MLCTGKDASSAERAERGKTCKRSVLCTGKDATGAKRGKTCKRSVLCTEKDATGAKRGKTCERSVLCTGKDATGAKRGKTCERSVLCTGKDATGAKRGKTCKRCHTPETMQLVPTKIKLKNPNYFTLVFFRIINNDDALLTCAPKTLPRMKCPSARLGEI